MPYPSPCRQHGHHGSWAWSRYYPFDAETGREEPLKRLCHVKSATLMSIELKIGKILRAQRTTCSYDVGLPAADQQNSPHSRLCDLSVFPGLRGGLSFPISSSPATSLTLVSGAAAVASVPDGSRYLSAAEARSSRLSRFASVAKQMYRCIC
jgi:hypothetical protein